MQYFFVTNSYNHRRMGKPWIAKVDFNKSTNGDFSWGDWTGDHYNGSAGILTINAVIGDIIAMGQKDNRRPKDSAPTFCAVKADGELLYIRDKEHAYKCYLGHKNNTSNLDMLCKERKLLLTRITEIDKIIKEGEKK